MKSVVTTFACACLLLSGCASVHWSALPPEVGGHTGPEPIVLDHGDHVEVVK